MEVRRANNMGITSGSIAIVALIAVLQNPWAAPWGRQSVPAPKTKPQTISIFVGPQTRDAFVDVDRGVLDSINDI
jgi:hypothetical protein